MRCLFHILFMPKSYFKHLKTKIMKKNLLIFLTLCISIIGYSQTFTDTFITYQVSSTTANTVRVTNYNTAGGTAVTIPDTVTHNSIVYDVTSINDFAFEDKNLSSVTLPNGLINIGQSAFLINNLQTVTIPDSVITLSEGAFSNNNLTSVAIGSGVTTIGEFAFRFNNLTTITIPDNVVTIEALAFNSNSLTSVQLGNGVQTIGDGAFGFNGGLQSVTIPSNVTTIGSNAFQNSFLTSITLLATTPPNITTGANDSFYNRSAIDLTIPSGTSAAYAAGGWTGFNSVTEVSSAQVGDTFVENFITYEVTSISPNEVEVNDYDHSGTTDVDIPATITNSSTTYNVTSIGNDAFNYNGPSGKITGVTFTSPSNITTIGDFAFRAQEITTVIIPSSVISISQYAFWSNDITSVTFENGIESIGANAFSANQITDIIIPSSVINIDQFAFQDNQITNATLSNNLISIGSAAFSQNLLQSIVIPNSVTNFSNAFSSNQLTSITLPLGITNIDVGAFRSNNLTHVTIPSTVTNIENTAFRNNPLATVTSQATIPPTIFTPGINDSFWNRSAIDLTIPVGTSAAYAAGGWTGFNSVTEAAALAVGDTFVVDFITYEVISVTPDTVEAIDYNTAGGTVVDIPATVAYSITTYDVTSVGSGAFSGNNLTNVTIPNSVTTIKNNALNNNQFTSIIIPESVTNIGNLAFGVNNLSTVVVLGTVPPTITTGGGQDTFANSSRSNINLILTGNTTDEYVTDSGALWTGFKMVFEATSATTLKVSDYDAANGTNVTIPGSITIPSTVFDVTEIGQSAFANRGITGVTIPDSATNIGISAFELNNLTSVTIPDNVTVISTTAFSQNSITNLVIGANVEIIGIGAFVDNSLTDISIPSNVTEIGLLAFGNNPSLASVTSFATVPPTITTGTNDTFIFDRSNTALHIPPGTLAAYVTDPGALWTGFNPVTEDATLSTSDFELENKIKVITNKDMIKVISSNSVKLKNYSLYNITGAKVSSGKETEISTTSFSSGIYILKLDFDKGSLIKKVAVN